MTLYYIPAETEAGARAVVSGIEAGRIPCLREYRDPTLAAVRFDAYPQGYRATLKLWAIERGASVPAPLAKPSFFDLAKAAAVLACFAVGIVAVGVGSLLS